MEFKTNLNPQQIDEFVLSQPNCHYGKTSMWAKWKEAHEKYKADYLGIYDNEELKATAILLTKKKWGMRYGYIPWGMCLDYQDSELLKAFCLSLKEYGKKAKLAFIKIDPNVKRYENDKDNEAITQLLIECGFKHKGYGYGYDGSWSNRFTLMIDIQPDASEIFKRFSSPRKSALKKHNVYSIHTSLRGVDDLDVLCRLEKILAEEKGFAPHSKEYFASIMNAFKNNHLYAVSVLNVDESIQKIDAELNSKKYAKDPEARLAKEKSKNDLIDLKKKYGNEVEIAAGLFLYANHMSWDLYLYKCSDFNFINGTDEIHQFMIQAMKGKGVETYDMCGFSGSTDPKDPYYGLYLYKSSFGSKIVEHIGEFNLDIQPNAWEKFNKTDRLYRRIRRKLNYLFNRK